GTLSTDKPTAQTKLNKQRRRILMGFQTFPQLYYVPIVMQRKAAKFGSALHQKSASGSLLRSKRGRRGSFI
ncbi:MAG: hypothetical protein ACREDW_02750, partial [Aestuariivirgaceae bacterium]